MRKNSQFFILAVLVSLLLSILAIIFIIVPNVSSLKDLSNRVAAKEQELILGREKVQAIKEASNVIKSAQRDIQLLGVAVPEKEKADEALVQVTTAATSAGITVDRVVISPTETNSVNFTVSANGSYTDTITFMANLEKNLRPAKISDYSLSSNSLGSQVNSTFTVSFPYLPEAATASATASVSPTATQTNLNQKDIDE